MESKTRELVKAGHELVVLLGNQHGMLDAASLVQRLTAQLDITAAALREMTKKRDDEHADVLAWEKTMFKVCGEDGTKSVAAKFASLEARCAELAAENAKLGSQPIPVIPASDAWQREQMAKGVEAFARWMPTYNFDWQLRFFAAQLRNGEAV